MGFFKKAAPAAPAETQSVPQSDVKPVSASEKDAYLKEVGGLERDFIHEIMKSRRAAWVVAGVAVIFGAVGMAGGFMGFKQEAPTPLILRVDNATGAVDVIESLKDGQRSYGDVVDQYWLIQYVSHREAYDYDTLQRDYDLTYLMSGFDVQQEYSSLYSGANSLDSQYKDRITVISNVVSVDINPVSTGDVRTATVRFTTQKKYSNGRIDPVENKVATIGFKYENMLMTPAQRKMNPLGFQIVSYRWSPETLGTR